MPYSGSKLHPTQKPVFLMATLIRSFSLASERILDPFARSGSTSALAALAGRKYIGMELDEMYFIHSIEKMARVQRGIADKKGPRMERLQRSMIFTHARHASRRDIAHELSWILP